MLVRDRVGGGDGFDAIVGEVTDDTFHVIGNDGGDLLVHTDRGAPNGRVVRIDPADAAESRWKTVVTETAEPIERATLGGTKLFVTYMKDVTARVRVHSLDGIAEGDVALPGLGSCRGIQRGAGRVIRFLHLHVVHVSNDAVSVRRFHPHEHGISSVGRPGVRCVGIRDRPRYSPRARTARACRCSSCIAKVSCAMAATRPNVRLRRFQRRAPRRTSMRCGSRCWSMDGVYAA